MNVSVDADGLDDVFKEDLLCAHIPYRLWLILDAWARIHSSKQRGPWLSVIDKNASLDSDKRYSKVGLWGLSDSQAFEAGAVAGRQLLSFLGLGIGVKDGKLKESKPKDDDAHVTQLGGRAVSLNLAVAIDKENRLEKFIRGVHKACAHLTINARHDLNLDLFYEVVPLIIYLYRQSLDNKLPIERVENDPKMLGALLSVEKEFLNFYQVNDDCKRA